MKRRAFLGFAGGMMCSCGGKSDEQFWTGIVFGIPVGIRFRSSSTEDAEKLGAECLAIAQNYEASFSLWDENSELSRLNRQGELMRPSKGLWDCLKIARSFHEKSGGLFDPSIHSYLEWMRVEYAAGRVPDQGQAERRREAVDFSRVELSEKAIRLEQGMALSLNALAQGYVTDRVCDFLESQVSSALVNFGEFRVVGSMPFPVEVQDAKLTIDLERAMAVSSGGGQRLSATASANHLIRPGNGSSPDPKEIIVVEADQAVDADAIATIVALGGAVPEGFGEVEIRRV
ncbi:FAD:protein FMN transferase [Akkermansiaceae bacterium]|nr:FAD:protein FMN transferase [Akkermansiaceae bacterium]